MSVPNGYRMVKKIWRKRFLCIALAGILGSTMVPGKQSQTAMAAGKKTAGEEVYDGKDGQPYVPCYFPEDLLNWDKEKDGDLPYNISYVPLAERVEKGKLEKSVDTQSEKARLLVISSINANTSGNFSQGSSEFMKKGTNMFSYWQYADTLVYWGGSAGEGIIVPPAGDVIDEAHRNGVPVLGTVFFAPNVYGGKLEWVKQMIRKNPGGSFPAGDKLIELAETIHFDGWFLNQETEGTTKEDARAFQELIQYMKKKAPELKIYYYDAMTKTGEVDWQNALTEENQAFLKDEEGEPVADAMFLNFWWTNESWKDKELLKASNEKAAQLGIDPYSLFAGIDVEANGYGTKVRWNLFEKENGETYTSLGLFKPSWTYESAAGESRNERAADFARKEEGLWVNEFGDPSVKTKAEDRDWKGMSTYFMEQSPITRLPFTTSFSMGQGRAYYVNGEKVGDRDWNNRSMQDVMPTYRYTIKGEGKTELKGAVDYDTAYNGGSSLILRGTMETGKPAVMKLFAADVPVREDTVVSVAANSNAPVNMDLILDFQDGTAGKVSGGKEVEAWTENVYSLKEYAGKSIRTISLSLEGQDNSSAQIHIGAFAIRNGQETRAAAAKPVVKGVYSPDGINAGIRIHLGNKTKETSYYEIYRITQDGRAFYGATVNPDYYLGNIKRGGKQDTTEFEAVAVSTTGQRAKGVPFTMRWGSYPAPAAAFSVDKTYITPGSSIQFTSKCSETTEKVLWEFTGGSVKTSSEANPVVTFQQPGIYSVTLTASNTTGESKAERKDYIVVEEKAKDIKNLSLEKPVSTSSFVNEKEAGPYAVDGSLETKWCAVGDGPHSIVIDLEKESLVSQVDISHAEAGGEGSGYNTRGFRILVSRDGKTFTEAEAVADNEAAVSRTPVKPVKTRYVKLIIDKATQGGEMAARIYEIQIKGTN